MIKDIKLQVETEEQNQYVLNKLIDVNKGCVWNIYLYYGYDYYTTQLDVLSRAVCSVWKGFRYLVINEDGDLTLFVFEKHYNNREEKEIKFEEFEKMVETKDTIEVNSVTYKRVEEK